MKIIVLHGDHEIKSYERLCVFITEAKKRNWKVVRLGKKTNFSLPETLSSSELFEKERFFILEDIYQLSKKDIEWIAKNCDKIDGTLIIYHKNTINKTLLKKLPGPDKIEEFKLPKLIWNLLDSVYPKNAKNALLLLHEVVKNEPVEFVFALIARHLRDLYWAKIGADTIPYPKWRVGKLSRQASKFDDKKLKVVIEDLADIDIKSKTSRTNLIDLLDFVLATKLE